MSPRRMTAGFIALCVSLLPIAPSGGATWFHQLFPSPSSGPAQRTTEATGRFTAPLWVNPSTGVARATRSLLAVGMNDRARALQVLADEPTGVWLTSTDLTATRQRVQSVVAQATQADRLVTLVPYAIPDRGCSPYSALPAAESAAHYRSWISTIAQALGSYRAIIVLEPDATGLFQCLTQQQQQQRLQLLSEATKVLAHQGSWVYIDAAHTGWLSPQVAASRLKAAGVADATGFAVNVANFQSTDSQIAYGRSISRLVGGKHFIIDTSRNGVGTARSDWCNPPGQGLGKKPTLVTHVPLVDAFLWVKRPGNSDGPCHGGPAVGTFWESYALGLIARAHF
ncbi:glycoside hydrolase family 6 protein [Amnibacterium sp. CER49]|uniref:glycoside hydrolase family 6 protein n=1 Tax=Amnibacterium sp. CER49 TaxID=3039161 RepID=UPI00244C9A73|nr:glycoside hydrolase family 6 protein [Amnibacterium sp. CER49]MDH2443016.1 glycoside hydrolase family 6 protein [Amnibacterium sp. CER49]